MQPSSLAGPPGTESATAVTIREIVERRQLRTVFQPIVELRSGEVIGYEALTRGPEGSPFESPGALFSAADAAGLSDELDWACLAMALHSALIARVHPSRAVYINVEPSSLARPTPDWLTEFVELARRELTFVLEITARALTGTPAALLAATARLRDHGAMIALDGVGVDFRSLALLPFVDPEVVKLDLGVDGTGKLARTTRVSAAVHAHSERSGARILAERIETLEHRSTALALGAELGQGWLFGRPRPLPPEASEPASSRALVARPPDVRSAKTPFVMLSTQLPVRRGTKELLLHFVRRIEAQVESDGEAAVLLATFQEDDFFSAAVRERYRGLATRSALVGALGVGAEPEPGVHGASLLRSEPLRGEWDVCAITPYLAAALVARDLGDTGPDHLRRFDFIVTHERELVIGATRALMVRLAGD